MADLSQGLLATTWNCTASGGTGMLTCRETPSSWPCATPCRVAPRCLWKAFTALPTSAWILISASSIDRGTEREGTSIWSNTSISWSWAHLAKLLARHSRTSSFSAPHSSSFRTCPRYTVSVLISGGVGSGLSQYPICSSIALCADVSTFMGSESKRHWRSSGTVCSEKNAVNPHRGLEMIRNQTRWLSRPGHMGQLSAMGPFTQNSSKGFLVSFQTHFFTVVSIFVTMSQPKGEMS
mmetsp:Transcript_95881/g.253263  ORF Transcript_95881/g.253263 Transcript_95881/m.253263 type:complete len:237 (+) Transcript_95881:856-1566(+)